MLNAVESRPATINCWEIGAFLRRACAKLRVAILSPGKTTRIQKIQRPPVVMVGVRDGNLRPQSPPDANDQRLFSIRSEQLVHQRDIGVDHRMAQALLLGDKLHQLVSTLDIGCAIEQRASG